MLLNPHAKCCSSKFNFKLFKKKKNGGHLNPGNTLIPQRKVPFRQFNGKFSQWVEVLAGVPQGSILGPLLLLIFIDAIVERIGGSIRLFADDIS